jgi:ribonuclease HI
MFCFAEYLGVTTSYQVELCGAIIAIEIAHQMNGHKLWLETDPHPWFL